LGGGMIAGHLLSMRKKRTIRMVEPGDMIQWESRGAFVFQEPQKVSYTHNSDMGIYVFVEGTATGIPIDQVVLIKEAKDG
jgi:hypothetical protein